MMIFLSAYSNSAGVRARWLPAYNRDFMQSIAVWLSSFTMNDCSTEMSLIEHSNRSHLVHLLLNLSAMASCQVAEIIQRNGVQFRVFSGLLVLASPGPRTQRLCTARQLQELSFGALLPLQHIPAHEPSTRLQRKSREMM